MSEATREVSYILKAYPGGDLLDRPRCCAEQVLRAGKADGLQVPARGNAQLLAEPVSSIRVGEDSVSRGLPTASVAATAPSLRAARSGTKESASRPRNAPVRSPAECPGARG